MAKKIKTGSVFFRDQYSRLVDGGGFTLFYRKISFVPLDVQLLTFQGQQQGWAILAPGSSALYAEAAPRSLL